MNPPAPPHALTGRTVLVPGTAATAHGVIAALAEAGAHAVAVPLIETAPVTDPAPIDRAMRSLAAGGYQWLAVTSAAAVRALDERLRVAPAWGKARSLAEVLDAGRARCAAVGDATASELHARGVVALVPEHGSGAAALVGPLATSARGDRVLFARGDLAGPALVGGLRGSGVSVDDVVVYVTAPAPRPAAEVVTAWAEGRVDAVLLTSPSTARALLDAFGPPRPGTLVACIGPTTAQAARDLHLRVDVISPTPSATALVTALAVGFATRPA